MKQILLRPVLALLVFLAMQMAGSILLMVALAVCLLVTGSPMSAVNQQMASPLVISLALIISSVGTIVILHFMKMIEWKSDFNRVNVKASTILLSLLGGLCGVVALNILSEFMDLPDILSQQMVVLCQTVWGALSVALVGPIAEELAFRGAIQGWMMRHGAKPWLAIAVASLLFGIGHLNPAQIPFAFLMGCILGFIYYRSGSLWLCILLHVVNNSLSVIQTNAMGNEVMSFRLVDWLGGTGPSLAIMLSGAVVCLAALWLFSRCCKTMGK